MSKSKGTKKKIWLSAKAQILAGLNNNISGGINHNLERILAASDSIKRVTDEESLIFNKILDELAEHYPNQGDVLKMFSERTGRSTAESVIICAFIGIDSDKDNRLRQEIKEYLTEHGPQTTKQLRDRGIGMDATVNALSEYRKLRKILFEMSEFGVISHKKENKVSIIWSINK